MDILWALLTLPYAPVRGLTAVVKVIAREAESQQHDPVNVRRELEALDRAAAAGDITERERDRAQQRILDRLTPTGERQPGRDPGGARRGTGAHRGDGSSRRRSGR
ncbi:gas vesicle protein GvpG [Plantactinospora sp. BB1]|uniref:gas vesicle protein GvpG n=1 Tax=Plantactinospora sp. BB1 TaxID=2071627 RepID=UPI000D17E7CD|nr:gas vesicle protein GvpG [Plantactinospora sp. BB1]AVT38077.1 gas vesicle protein G [Plantactinospora sp. BB1]